MLPHRPISDRELQIIKQISKGQTSKEIARLLKLSVHTIDTHRRNIIKKLKVNNTNEAVAKSLKMGWLE